VGFSKFFVILICDAHTEIDVLLKLLETDQENLRTKLN